MAEGSLRYQNLLSVRAGSYVNKENILCHTLNTPRETCTSSNATFALAQEACALCTVNNNIFPIVKNTPLW